jgi:serine/threonine protein kinase
MKEKKLFLLKLSHKNLISIVDCGENCSGSSFTNRRVSFIALEFAKYGDLLELLMNGDEISEPLARTWFQKIIEGVEYMHAHRVAHMDLKLENVLIDANFNLKLCDFDVSQNLTDKKQVGAGTMIYRAPEVSSGLCKNFSAADIYSLGVILFILISGNPPYQEEHTDKGKDWRYDHHYTTMRKNNQEYWREEAKSKGKEDYFSSDLIQLINWMLAEDPEERPSIEDIKNHQWYKGKVLLEYEYQHKMEVLLGVN